MASRVAVSFLVVLRFLFLENSRFVQFNKIREIFYGIIKADFFYQIATIEEFYSILQNDKKVLEHGGNYVFQANTDK